MDNRPLRFRRRSQKGLDHVYGADNIRLKICRYPIDRDRDYRARCVHTPGAQYQNIDIAAGADNAVDVFSRSDGPRVRLNRGGWIFGFNRGLGFEHGFLATRHQVEACGASLRDCIRDRETYAGAL
jgi:hypothetical protein